MAGIPLLSKIFEAEPGEPVVVTVGSLAKSLNVTMDRLQPIIRDGWIRAVSSGPITSQFQVQSPPPEALKWLIQWFQPATAKPLFSKQDMADLLNVPISQVLPIAAAHDIPVVYDSVLGHVWSIWAAKQMLLRLLSGGRGVQRFDRIALFWTLMEGDPKRISRVPTFDQALEDEIERVAQLDEPMRSARSISLMEQFRDARTVIEAAETTGRAGRLSCEPLLPESPACESSPSANVQQREAWMKKFYDLI